MQSRFYSDDDYNTFVNEISHMCNMNDYVFFFGDHNAQIAELPDYSINDIF